MDNNYETELAKAVIREEIRQRLGKVDGIFIIGPVTYDKEGNVQCVVRVEDLRKSTLPERLKIRLSGGAKEISLRVEEGPRIRSYSLCPGETANYVDVPNAGSDKDIRGGDACWPSGNSDEYGTIAIAAAEIKIRASATNYVSLVDACLTAGHVFGANPTKGDLLSVPGLPDCMAFEANLALDPTNATPNIDAGLAKIADVESYATGRIRGFGKFKTNKVTPPTAYGWITTVGAKSGVTIGFDAGGFDYTDDKGYLYKGLRWATPGVSCCHDSGAPVMDAQGNLVGMIVAGEDLECKLRPYSIYVPFRRWNVAGDPDLIHDLELKIVNK